MQIALIADTFPPNRSSGAVQLRDLSMEFVRQGYEITVILPTSNQKQPWQLENYNGVKVMRLKVPTIKDIGRIRRAFNEFMMPFAMLRQFKKSPLKRQKWDGIVWYSPSIFHGPLVSSLKKRSGCRGYLIIRDIFPQWAFDVGLITKGLPYQFFNYVARYQYSLADVIGVQTPSNLLHFPEVHQQRHKLEVLNNWLGKIGHSRCSIRLKNTTLSKCKVFVYAGNMGVAQGMDIILNLAYEMRHREDVGFLFVGRGSDVARLKKSVKEWKLNNVLFFEEIHPDEIPDLYRQCSAGIVALDSRHKTHNIPGKFLTYMQSGLPVLANVNAGNDLVKIINSHQVGQVCDSNQLEDLLQLSEKLLDQIEAQGSNLGSRCVQLFESEFAVDRAVRQIVASFR